MSGKNRVFLLTALIVALDIPLCRAQEEPAIEIPAIGFQDVLPVFFVGSFLDFTVPLADLVRTGSPDLLQARVFRGSRSYLEERRQFPMEDGCIFYRAGIFSLGQSVKGLQVLNSPRGSALTVNTGWLSRDQPDVGGDQYFVVVIEKRTIVKDYIKLRPEDVSRYFARGLEFVVKSNRRPTREEEKELFAAGRTGQAETTAVAEREDANTGEVKTRCRWFSTIQTTGTAYLRSEPCSGGVVAQALLGSPYIG
ncbi:MAG: hypothetical protein WAM82_04715 [Thermoanaerobaculia bacterium]